MLSLAIVDAKIWSPDLLLDYLYTQYKLNEPAVIDFMPEATCLQSAGVYGILDKFCASTGYSKSSISIRTANMIEHHNEYNIIRDVSGWYEIELLKEWCGKNNIEDKKPTYHFANFISRNHWSRLWIATILNTHYQNKTLQSYNYFNSTENYNPDRYVGLDDLVVKGCDLVTEVTEFLKTCPQTLDADTFPIQHPANLNLLKYYPDIFVDIVVETNVTGNSFLVTEKLWRPIMARRPFIVMGNCNYLLNLKRLGFRTFNSFWSEEYDQFDSEKRIKEIEKVLYEISRYSNLDQVLNDMKEILEHNYQTFMKLDHQQIARAFNA